MLCFAEASCLAEQWSCARSVELQLLQVSYLQSGCSGTRDI